MAVGQSGSVDPTGGPDLAKLADDALPAAVAPASDWHKEPDLPLQLLSHSPDCVKIIDIDGVVCYMNPPGLCLMEIDDFEAFRGKRWSDCWPASEQPNIVEALAAAIAGKVGRVSGLCPTAKGTEKWWDVVVSPILRADGAVKHILAISRDVTAQKRVEQRLSVSEQRFRALADNMAQFAWLADTSGAIFWYNKRWHDYTGLNRQECVGWGWQKAHHPDHVERVVKKISDHFARGEIWEDTFPLRGADGEYRWFLSRAMPIRDEAGAITLWCGTNTDITDQRNSSARLRQMARLIELSHEAILVWDLERGIVLWNEGCEVLYGYSRNEAVGARSHDLLKTARDISADEFEQKLTADGEWTGELLHFAKDGSEVWVDSRQELIRFGDRSVVLETNRDVTERRRADDTRNILVAELDHRVKNTLAIVQSIAGQTARNSKSISQFVTSFNDRLHALSAAHSVLTDANWKGAELTEVISNQVAEQGRRYNNVEVSGAKVQLSAQTALQLSLILHELMTNARKHGALTRPTGRVSITWRIQEGTPCRLRLIWRERGGPAVQPPSNVGFGTTLISRAGSQQSVQAQLAFEPEGVVCHISADLPAPNGDVGGYFNPTRTRHAAKPVASAGSGAMPRARHQRVLIVEDEPLIALEIEAILSAAGFVLLGPVATVSVALEAIANWKMDCVVLDRNLSGEAVEPIIAELLVRQIPFAFVSGGSDEKLGPVMSHVPYVRKPIQPQKLVEAVKVILASQDTA